MLKYVFVTFLIFNLSKAQEFEGYWKTVDNNGVEKSIVKIYKTQNGYVEGKIHRILKSSERDRLCTKCKGDKKNKPIEGLVIIEDLKPKGYKCVDGKITDPEKGKTYTCKLWIEEDNEDVLHVRGYWAFFYRTQHWKRIEDLQKVINQN